MEETALAVFGVENLHPFEVDTEDNGERYRHAVGGRIVVRNSVTHTGERIGFVYAENSTYLMIEMRQDIEPKKIIVKSQRIIKTETMGTVNMYSRG